MVVPLCLRPAQGPGSNSGPVGANNPFSTDDDDTPAPCAAPPPQPQPQRPPQRRRRLTAQERDAAHAAYMERLAVPTREAMAAISARQAEKRQDLALKSSRTSQTHNEGTKEEQQAAGLIQRNYRGYRERRQLEGLRLDASTRWTEAIKEAQYRNMTKPMSRNHRASQHFANGTPEEHRGSSVAARQNWKRIGQITRRAGGDDGGDLSDYDDSINETQRQELKQRRLEAKHERDRSAKVMDLQYFLEMVDVKHRYGSNLRSYHNEWKRAETNENFFYWLDHGEGKQLDLPLCPRERLEREQVRYLSREERMDYLVKIDHEGKLCWAKNGARIDTSEHYKDSIHGIVPAGDETPPFLPADEESLQRHRSSSSDSSSSSSSDTDEAAEGDHYVNHDLKQAKGPKKIKHVSAATIFNRLLRKTVRNGTWIFVADTSFRLYVGIKQSGAFQHSSFLHGARISAAGLIKIRNGQLRSLAPLSGHYRPPSANFRAFIHNLRVQGVDMSHLTISKSYAVLIGLEAYMKTRQKVQDAGAAIAYQKDKTLHPEAVRQREEAAKDKSKSAERERQLQREHDEEAERTARKLKEEHGGHATRLMHKLGLHTPRSRSSSSASATASASVAPAGPSDCPPGHGAEDAIPPEGRR